MPLFEYHCAACGKHFEKITSLKERDTISCPACGIGPAQRQISTFAAQTGSTSEPMAPCGQPHSACACCSHRS